MAPDTRGQRTPAPIDPRLKAAVLAAALFGVLWGLHWAQSVIIPVLLAAMIATLTAPAVSWLQSHRVPHAAAVILIVVGLLVLLLGVAALVGGSVNQFASQAPQYEARLQGIVDSSMERVAGLGVDTESLQGGGAVSLSSIMGFLATNLKALGDALGVALTILLILVFILLEVPAIKPKLVRILREHGTSFEGADLMMHQVRRYFGVKTAVSFGTGTCIAIFTALIGLDFPLVWGLTAFLLNYIPTVGSIVAAIPVVLFALLQSGIGTAALVGLGLLAVNVLFGNIIEPPLMGRTLGLSTLTVFLSLLFWGWLWGPEGMLLSALLTMIVKSACERIPGMEWFAVVLGPAPEEMENEP